MSPAPDDATMTPLDWVLATVCCGIGFIVGLVYLLQGKPKSGRMILVSVIVFVVVNVLAFALTAIFQARSA